MKIAHLAIWVSDLELMKSFYERYFNGRVGERYVNPIKKFSSYFVHFDEGATLELMIKDGVVDLNDRGVEHMGITHFAMELDGEQAVNELTERLRNDGYMILGEPRTSGDGFYESVVADPEGNRIELVYPPHA